MKKYLAKYFYLLNCKRKKLFFLLGLFLITSAFDMLGIGLIGPFITLVMSPENVEKSTILMNFTSFLTLKI